MGITTLRSALKDANAKPSQSYREIMETGLSRNDRSEIKSIPEE